MDYHLYLNQKQRLVHFVMSMGSRYKNPFYRSRGLYARPYFILLSVLHTLTRVILSRGLEAKPRLSCLGIKIQNLALSCLVI